MAARQLGLGALLICALEILAPQPLQARPRDEVMSRAFRCAIIGDTRLWLDCYYGAAQPARAALGLQPAPAGQLNLVMAPPAGNPTPTDVTTRDQVLSNTIHCTELADDHQWLDCYYAAAQPMRALLGLSAGQQAVLSSKSTQSSIATSIKPVPQGAISAATNFGLQVKSNALDHSADHIEASMTKYTFDKFGIFTVTLDNGQVWYQLSGDTQNAHWHKPAASYTVRISHGFLGSYNLTVKGSPDMFKVRRMS